MADDKKDPWLNYLALSTVILAVCATLSTFKAGGYSTRSVLSQTKAADQWAYYQSKSIKGYLYEIQRDRLKLDLLAPAGGKGSAALRDGLGKMVDEYESKLQKYQSEKAEIEKRAKDLEAARDTAAQHGQVFGLAVIFLQIAILLSSIAALLKKKGVWYLSLVAGAGGVLYFLNGFYMFLPL